jgi:uncharacterized protein YqeY
MNLKDRINEELKTSMKAGDKVRTETIRSLRAGIIEFEKSGAEREMSSDDELKILMSAAKKRREAIEMYDQHDRPELAEKERAELAVIQEFLPKQMSREEITDRIRAVILETGAAGPQDTNKVIPILMKELKGKVDGKIVQEIVKDELMLRANA